MNAITKQRRMGAVVEAQLPTVEILKQTPIEQLEETVKALKKHRPAREVRQAMIDLICSAPLAHFQTLKVVFLAHCADGAQ